MSDTAFVDSVLHKIYNKQCIGTVFSSYNGHEEYNRAFMISKKEYESYNHPDSILKKYFYEAYSCYVMAMAGAEEVPTMPKKYLKKSWCYGKIDNYNLPREILICFLVLFDNHYIIEHGSPEEIFSIMKMPTDKEVHSIWREQALKK